MHYAQGVAFFCGKGTQIGFCELNKGAVVLEPKRLRTRQEVVDTIRTMGLREDANLTTLRNSINQHLVGLRNLYKEKKFPTNQINFWANEDLMTFSCIHVIDLELIYAATISAQQIVSIIVSKDGVGLRGQCKPLIIYGRDWREVHSITTSSGSLYVTHTAGVEEVSLSDLKTTRVIHSASRLCAAPHTVAPHEGGIIVSDPENHRLLKWWRCEGKIEQFAGDGFAGNCDGIASKCRFFQPTGVCTEFNNVVYVCDAQTSCIKIFTTLNNTARFLRAVGALYSAFSIHEKHEEYSLCSLPTAISRVGDCLHVLEENVSSIRNMGCILPQTLNGSQGSVVAKTVDSVKLLRWSLERLQENLEQFSYENTNLLSCMTLDVENLHASVHHKSQVSTVLQYARDFRKTAKEGLKRTTSWSAHYYTSR